MKNKDIRLDFESSTHAIPKSISGSYCYLTITLIYIPNQQVY